MTDSARGPLYALPRGALLHEYRVESVLGRGSFGITYLATDTLLAEQVAIKEYLPSDLAARFSDKTVGPKSEDDQENFQRGLEAYLNEARIIARFRHQNIVQVRRYFEQNGTGYIVFNKEEGLPLDKWLAKGLLPAEQTRQILLGTLAGLAVVHEAGVLHRDIKPSNIIMRPDGSPVLIDFGAARVSTQDNLTTIMSPAYAPPEQYGEGGTQGYWTDFYALGATLYQCVTGERPADSLYRLQQSLAKKDPLIPAERAGVGRYDGRFLRLIDWMLRLKETERPQSVADIRKYLEAGDFKLKPRTQATGSSRPVVLAGCVVAALILGVIGFWLWGREATTHDYAASLSQAGYDRTKLDAFSALCGETCPSLYKEEAKARFTLLQTEAQTFEAAKGNLERLHDYIATCRACEFQDEARNQSDALWERRLAQAGSDRTKLQQFLSSCNSDCPEPLSRQARQRLDEINTASRDTLKDATSKDVTSEPIETEAAKPDDTKPDDSKQDDGKKDTGKHADTAKPQDKDQQAASPVTQIVTDPVTLNEIRDRLFEQNYDPGPPGSTEMASAIQAYSEKTGLARNDKPTLDLLDSLRRAPSLGPWSAITFSKPARKWGMAWNLATRRAALASAQKRCGSEDCLATVSFFGERCGAFALSTQGWGMAWHNDIQSARQSALEMCEKRGAECRIIGAVCADGSERFPQ